MLIMSIAFVKIFTNLIKYFVKQRCCVKFIVRDIYDIYLIIHSTISTAADAALKQ